MKSKPSDQPFTVPWTCLNLKDDGLLFLLLLFLVYALLLLARALLVFLFYTHAWSLKTCFIFLLSQFSKTKKYKQHLPFTLLIHFSLPFHLLLGRSISLSLPPSFFLSSPPSLFLVKKVQVHSRFKSVSQQVFICKPFFTALHSLTFTLSFVDLTKQYFEISKQLIW